MREVLQFFDDLKENIPQFLVGHVTEKIDDVTYKILIDRGRPKGIDKGFDEFEVEATLLLPSIQTNRGVLYELKRGERVLVLYANKTYFIIGSLKKEGQKDFKRIDIAKFPNKQEKRSFVIKPNGGTEVAIDENDVFVLRTKNQKLQINPVENVVELKTKDGRSIKVDDRNKHFTLKTPTFSILLDDENKKLVIKANDGQLFEMDVNSDALILKSAQGYGIKVQGSNVEIHGAQVDFYNTPF